MIYIPGVSSPARLRLSQLEPQVPGTDGIDIFARAPYRLDITSTKDVRESATKERRHDNCGEAGRARS